MEVKLSNYAKCLAKNVRERYIEKLSKINFEDPYLINIEKTINDTDEHPSITYPDIVNYLLFAPSPYTAEQLKCFKSLEGYNQFVNGWVRNVYQKRYDKLFLVKCRVMHSQKLSETPLTPWVICTKSGQILSAHCDCMAGLGESCTHVAALLFFLESVEKLRESQTVTDKSAYWVETKSKKVGEVKGKEISMTDFSSSRSLKRK